MLAAPCTRGATGLLDATPRCDSSVVGVTRERAGPATQATDEARRTSCAVLWATASASVNESVKEWSNRGARPFPRPAAESLVGTVADECEGEERVTEGELLVGDRPPPSSPLPPWQQLLQQSNLYTWLRTAWLVDT